MKKLSDKSKIVVVFLFIFVIAIIKDLSAEEIKNGVVDRGEIGAKEKEISLNLNVEKLLKDYEFSLNILPMMPRQEEAENYFLETIVVIDKDFEGEYTDIPLKKSYLDGLVKADWSFKPYGIIDSEGNVNTNKLQERETIIQAQAELQCGSYERVYQFSFLYKKPELSESEKLLQEIENGLQQQMMEEGREIIELPSEINGYPLHWSEEKEYLTPKILLLEILAFVLLIIFTKRKQKEDEKKRLQDMERDYADIVSQLSLLLGAGMTAKQAWNRLAMQYNFKRRCGMIEKKQVYESILRMNGRFLEGVSERMAYQQFREEIPANSYHKLMRILLGSLEKGTQGIEMRLEEESQLAFEQKILLAKKRGEEASTKMLGPLMFMLVIVMGIIMIPALIGFQL